jgi:U3 small nucleolar RNA-associated protein 20
MSLYLNWVAFMYLFSGKFHVHQSYSHIYYTIISLQVNASTKQFKELRTLCLRVISLALNKFEDHNFGSDFWDILFTSVRPLVDRFKLEGASSEKPSSLFSCFITMSKSPKLVSLLARQPNLVPTVFSILSVSTASDAIVSAVLEFVENLLKLDNDLDLDEREDNLAKEVLLPHVDVLVQSLHDLYKIRSEFQRWCLNFSFF